MINERTLAEMMLNISQEECREIGELFLSLAKPPRDAAWKSTWRRRLEELPKSTLATEMDAARKRLEEYERENPPLCTACREPMHSFTR